MNLLDHRIIFSAPRPLVRVSAWRDALASAKRALAERQRLANALTAEKDEPLPATRRELEDLRAMRLVRYSASLHKLIGSIAGHLGQRDGGIERARERQENRA